MVIAIIAILAAIVTVSVTRYVAKSKLVAIQADMKQLSILAVQYSVSHDGLYGGFCDDSSVVNIGDAVAGVNISSDFGFDCGDPTSAPSFCEADNKWVAIALDRGAGEERTFYFCIDSHGTTKTEGIGQDNYENCDCL